MADGSSPPVRAKPRGRYHHGDLPAALRAAALQLVLERGPSGFTLKEAAEVAGVSAAAPYRHFDDRENLLVAAAAERYEQLVIAMESIESDDPAERLAALLETFVTWAIDERAAHRILFVSGLDKTSHADVAALGNRATTVLATAAADVAGGPGPKADQLMLSAYAIAQGHALVDDDPAVARAGLLQTGDAARLAARAVLALARDTEPS